MLGPDALFLIGLLTLSEMTGLQRRLVVVRNRGYAVQAVPDGHSGLFVRRVQIESNVCVRVQQESI